MGVPARGRLPGPGGQPGGGSPTPVAFPEPLWGPSKGGVTAKHLKLAFPKASLRGKLPSRPEAHLLGFFRFLGASLTAEGPWGGNVISILSPRGRPWRQYRIAHACLGRDGATGTQGRRRGGSHAWQIPRDGPALVTPHGNTVLCSAPAPCPPLPLGIWGDSGLYLLSGDPSSCFQTSQHILPPRQVPGGRTTISCLI